jgi:hypothetical protein
MVSMALTIAFLSHLRICPLVISGNEVRGTCNRLRQCGDTGKAVFDSVKSLTTSREILQLADLLLHNYYHVNNVSNVYKFMMA